MPKVAFSEQMGANKVEGLNGTIFKTKLDMENARKIHEASTTDRIKS
jgi:hypothetical protein